jgi:20S proteasome alpha/beta subunit
MIGLRLRVEFAHREGYTRSEQDVTIQRVVTSVSAPIKKAFSDFSYAPILARSLFVELGSQPDQDQFYSVDFDGDYHLQRDSVTLTGRDTAKQNLHETIPRKTSVEKAVPLLKEYWLKLASNDGENEVSMDGLVPDILLLERGTDRENVFRSIEL